MSFARYVLLATCCASSLAPSAAAPPRVDQLFPAGARAGERIEVTAIGAFASWPVDAWSSSSKIVVEPLSEKGKLAIDVGADTPPGVHWIRLYDRGGASTLRPFVVGLVPEILEKEPNGAPGEAQLVAGAQTINGRLDKREDVDTFAVELARGQTLVASLEANRHLLSPMDGILQIVSERGFVLEQNDDHHERDPQIVYTAPESGVYIVRLFALPIPPNSSIRFASGETYVYRLTVTTGPFVDHVFPLAVSRARAAEVTLSGWNIPASLKRILLAADRQGDENDYVFLRHSDLGNAPRVRLVADAVVVDDEGLADGETQAIQCPATISGRIDPPGDADRYRFRAEKGERFVFEVEARRLGAPTDAVLRVLDGSDTEVSRVDDAGGADPRISFTAPATGEYVVEVTELFDHGGPRYVYTLDALRPGPDYALSLEKGEVVVAPGENAAITVGVLRQHGFEGEVEVTAIGLPAGLECPRARSLADGDTAKAVKLELTAAAGSGVFSGVIRIVGSQTGASGTLRTATFATGGSNEPCDLLWLTVLEAAAKEAAPD